MGGFVKAREAPRECLPRSPPCQAAQSGANPPWQTGAAGGSLQSHPTSVDEERKEAKGERLATHQCLTGVKSSTRLAQVDLIPHREV